MTTLHDQCQMPYGTLRRSNYGTPDQSGDTRPAVVPQESWSPSRQRRRLGHYVHWGSIFTDQLNHKRHTQAGVPIYQNIPG